MYVTTKIRFTIWDGNPDHMFTVEWSRGIKKWFVFKDDNDTDAVYVKDGDKLKDKDITCMNAESVLYEYLNI